MHDSRGFFQGTFGAIFGALALLLLVDTAKAATFTVDRLTTGGDITIDGTCDADGSVDVDCSLNAAMEEANATAAADLIRFKKGSVAGGDADDVSFDPSANPLFIDGPPPTITQPLTVDAGNCSADPDDPGEPCVTVESGWIVDSAGEVTITGVAIVGGPAQSIGIRVEESNGSSPNVPDFSLTRSWFGVDREGAKAGTDMSASVQLEDVDGARIGSGFVQDRNLFAIHDVGIDILGADNTEIFGNAFGILPDGSLARTGENTPNGPNIEITGNSAPTPDDPATGTSVGASSDEAAATPECDVGCNLLLNSGIPGPGGGIGIQDFASIDLIAEPGENEIPAEGAKILGNEIASNGAGIKVGDADNVQIGGGAAGDADRNILTRNEIESSTGATGLLIENNLIDGGSSVDPSIDVKGRGEVIGNFMKGGGPTAAIRLSDTTGAGFSVQGNRLGQNVDGSSTTLPQVGIDLAETASGNRIGGEGPGEGNVVIEVVPPPPIPPSAINSVGIRVAGDDNEIVGNRIGDGDDGLTIGLSTGIDLRTDADGNVVGGNTAESENEIRNARKGGPAAPPGNAITVADAASDSNLILRNRGGDNEGLFIDLGNDGAGNLAEPNGPNGGAQAPAIAVLDTETASGTTAPGAVVRLYTKATSAPGEIEGFLAQATADVSGDWSTPISAPVGTLVTANATGSTGTSEMSATATVVEAPDTDPPETTITKQPKDKLKVKKKAKATYEFGSDEAGAFTCKVDKKPAKPCTSPLKLKKLKKGKHTFTVFATDEAGNSDATPATDTFKVKKKKRR